MLIPVTATDIPDFQTACAYEHVFGSRALTALRTYGLGSADAHFFLCRKGREPSAALYLLGDVLTISSDDRADPAPIAELAQRMQVHEIDTNWTQCQALQKLLGQPEVALVDRLAHLAVQRSVCARISALLRVPVADVALAAILLLAA